MTEEVTYDEAIVAIFRQDPELAAEYLKAVLEDGNREELMLALRRIADAFESVQRRK